MLLVNQTWIQKFIIIVVIIIFVFSFFSSFSLLRSF